MQNLKLLKAALTAFNSIRNTTVMGTEYKNTYAIAAALGDEIKAIEESTIKEKMIIVIRGANVSEIFSTNKDIEILTVDYDLIENGESPVYEHLRYPDQTFVSGQAHTLFTDADVEVVEAREEIKRIKF